MKKQRVKAASPSLRGEIQGDNSLGPQGEMVRDPVDAPGVQAQTASGRCNARTAAADFQGERAAGVLHVVPAPFEAEAAPRRWRRAFIRARFCNGGRARPKPNHISVLVAPNRRARSKRAKHRGGRMRAGVGLLGLTLCRAGRYG